MNVVALGSLALLGLRWAAEAILGWLNRRAVLRAMAAPRPAAVSAVMDEATFRRSAEYTLARSRFGVFSDTWEVGVLAIALYSGIGPRIFIWTERWGRPGTSWTDALFVVLFLSLMGAASVPLGAWEQFRIESTFGFNRMGAGLWIADRAKGTALSWALGFPLAWAVFALMGAVGRGWWIWGWMLMMAVQCVLLLAYPRWILPLFNRLSPLPEGALKARLLALAERTAFRAAAIQLMDGSRRSSHSNAFFTGFGRFRRIVLYDTLVERLEPEELEAVLAHEIGHYQLGHVPKALAMSTIVWAVCFAGVAYLISAPWFAASFGYPAGAVAPAAFLAMLLAGPVGFWISPLANLLSRRNEYAADAFARRTIGTPAPMVASLRKLARDNLSNLTPHPWFSAFHYSHPTLVERERALAESR